MQEGVGKELRGLWEGGGCFRTMHSSPRELLGRASDRPFSIAVAVMWVSIFPNRIA